MGAGAPNIQSADWSMMLDATAGGAPGSGLGQLVQGLADVEQCMVIILTTPKGSDPLRPTFACDLWKYVDRPIDQALPAIVLEVTDALTLWEPRITVVSVNAQVLTDGSSQSGAKLAVTVVWQLKTGGAQQTTTTTIRARPNG